jgi:hypothetical protein
MAAMLIRLRRAGLEIHPGHEAGGFALPARTDDQVLAAGGGELHPVCPWCLVLQVKFFLRLISPVSRIEIEEISNPAPDCPERPTGTPLLQRTATEGLSLLPGVGKVVLAGAIRVGCGSEHRHPGIDQLPSDL